MCVAIAGQIVELKGEEALINFNGIKKWINLTLVEGVSLQDYVLVHAGCAIEKLTQEEANEIVQSFIELGVLDEEEFFA